MSIHQDTFRCYLPHMFKLTEEQILIFVVVHFYASAVVDFFCRIQTDATHFRNSQRPDRYTKHAIFRKYIDIKKQSFVYTIFGITNLDTEKDLEIISIVHIIVRIFVFGLIVKKIPIHQLYLLPKLIHKIYITIHGYQQYALG